MHRMTITKKVFASLIGPFLDAQQCQESVQLWISRPKFNVKLDVAAKPITFATQKSVHVLQPFCLISTWVSHTSPNSVHWQGRQLFHAESIATRNTSVNGATLGSDGATLESDGATLGSDGATLGSDGATLGSDDVTLGSDGATL